VTSGQLLPTQVDGAPLALDEGAFRGLFPAVPDILRPSKPSGMEHTGA
jgi:hypothetical protein